MTFIIKLLSRLPLWLLYILSYKLYVLMFYVIGYRKKVVLDNMRNSFPEKSEDEIKQIAKRFYARFADFMVETLKGITISEASLRKRVHFKNASMLNKYVEQQQSVVFLVSHQFNWEWALLAAAFNLPMPMDGIYKKLSNAKMNELILKARSRFGAHLIEKDSSQREIVKRRKVLKGIAIVADQLPVQSSPAEKYWGQFLNQETAFFVGAERIAKLLQLPTVFMDIHATKRGYYEVVFREVSSPPYEKEGHEILETYVKATESLIRSEPEGWLWSHKRWKYKKERN